MATFITVVSFVVVAVGGLCTLLAHPSLPSHRLGDGLAQLGEMGGRTEMDFVTALGLQPTTISALSHGHRLLQWQVTGQHLAVLFTPDHRFVRITHRHGV